MYKEIFKTMDKDEGFHKRKGFQLLKDYAYKYDELMSFKDYLKLAAIIYDGERQIRISKNGKRRTRNKAGYSYNKMLYRGIVKWVYKSINPEITTDRLEKIISSIINIKPELSKD